jgi:2-octaprenyl-6-methoxyphenol hydroxylase
VPLPSNRSSLVWVTAPREAALLAELDPGRLSAHIEDGMHSMLGAVTIDGPVQTFPLSGMIAHEYGRGRIALVGEAAHVIPPIGAQGLNLGFRDVIALSEASQHVEGGDPGRAVAAYARARRIDVATRTFGIDLMNRSLLSPFLPVHLMRSVGLAALSRLSPLRSFAMREGMAPGGGFGSLGGRLRRRVDELRSYGRDRAGR